jgi:hypothetical protein
MRTLNLAGPMQAPADPARPGRTDPVRRRVSIEAVRSRFPLVAPGAHFLFHFNDYQACACGAQLGSGRDDNVEWRPSDGHHHQEFNPLVAAAVGCDSGEPLSLSLSLLLFTHNKHAGCCRCQCLSVVQCSSPLLVGSGCLRGPPHWDASLARNAYLMIVVATS